MNANYTLLDLGPASPPAITTPKVISLYMEPEADDISVLDYIFFSFQSKLSRFPAFCLASVFDEVIVMDDLSPDEAAFYVTVDLSRCL